MSTELYSNKLSYRAGRFRDVLILPQTPDSIAGLEAKALRVTEAFGLEVYNGAIWIPVSGGGSGSGGNYRLYGQFVVGSSPVNNGDTSYQNNALIGLYVSVFHNGALLYTGLDDRISYTYDILTGEITFNAPMGEGEVLAIFTYSVGMAGSGVTVVSTYADVAAAAAGLPHFIQVTADEELQESGQPAPISLYYWNGSETILIISKISETPSTGEIALSFSERVAVNPINGTDYIGFGTGALYYHYALCDYKFAAGTDGSFTITVGPDSIYFAIGTRSDDVNGHYNEYEQFAIMIGTTDIYSDPASPIASVVPGDKLRLRRVSDIMYIDVFHAGTWTEVYEIGTASGDRFIGISMPENAIIYNPIGENLIAK